MWQKLSDMAKMLFTFGKTLQQNRKISTAVQLLAREMQYIRENETHEREKMALRLENTLLKFDKRLPSPKKEDME